MGDSAELREGVVNLIFNAVDDMPHGGTIDAGTRVEGNTARFWIADTGTGMPAEVITRFFEPFYTLKANAVLVSGSRLRMASSSSTLGINVVSEPGKGTRFEVIPPLHEPTSSPVAIPIAQPGVARSARVLVVEDEENVRLLLIDAFRAEGYDVTEATTGAEALKHLNNSKFDLMVCDLGRPELSGLHVARWVKEFRPDRPVIIATGYAEIIAEQDYQNARIDDVIRKPDTLTYVLSWANALLAAQPATRETVTVSESAV